MVAGLFSVDVLIGRLRSDLGRRWIGACCVGAGEKTAAAGWGVLGVVAAASWTVAGASGGFGFGAAGKEKAIEDFQAVRAGAEMGCLHCQCPSGGRPPGDACLRASTRRRRREDCVVLGARAGTTVDFVTDECHAAHAGKSFTLFSLFRVLHSAAVVQHA